ncbi:hypothetical protein EVAR_85739_1 [Eumeta japonica]|uniref:Uncharacterized protein n=1 Tax=Eumeta variegata TaxID=151549 RepID=A0A4C1TMH8_EUMVA|nr:hypothetical protein EVAR_85739_1 [Eumeta japonica]
MDDAWWKSSRHRMSQETVGSVPPARPEAVRRPGGVRRLRWIGKYVSWPTDKVGGMRRLIVNRRAWSALGCDPDVEESLRCVLHIFGNSGEF